MNLTFAAVAEAEPGPEWSALHARTWEDYQRWFLQKGDRARPSYLQCERALKRHMPELMPAYEAVVDLAGGGDLAARLLSLYQPPAYLTGCSQAVWKRGSAALVRNYDYRPDLCEGVLLLSAWNDQRVMAMSDCLWGALDGVNEAGVAVALSFGGRDVVGDGFGIPLVLRYVLEFCETCEEAVKVLSRVPVHMAYNITVLDMAGAHATVHVAPDREAWVTSAQVATNHQGWVEWSAYARVTQSAEREAYLKQCVRDPTLTLEGLVDRFLTPPLLSRDLSHGHVTLYTADYRPAERSVDLLWPGLRWRQDMDAFEARACTIEYG